MEKIEVIKQNNYSLDVYKCQCGFVLGVDSDYLDDVLTILIRCPACTKMLVIEKVITIS